MGYVFALFLLTAYVPDPLPYIDEAALAGTLLVGEPKLLLLATVIFIVTMYFGFPPTGLTA